MSLLLPGEWCKLGEYWTRLCRVDAEGDQAASPTADWSTVIQCWWRHTCTAGTERGSCWTRSRLAPLSRLPLVHNWNNYNVLRFITQVSCIPHWRFTYADIWNETLCSNREIFHPQFCWYHKLFVWCHWESNLVQLDESCCFSQSLSCGYCSRW